MHRSPRSRHRLGLALAVVFGALVLGACGAQSSGQSGGAAETDVPASDAAPALPDVTAPASDANGLPLVRQPLADEAVPATDAGAPGAVDDTCTTDADCAVKDIGSCCGYFPACVNVNSPTFPEQVKAECERNGMQSVCGFPEISGCQCVEGRCRALDAGAGPVR